MYNIIFCSLWQVISEYMFVYFWIEPYLLAITVPPLLETRKVGYNERKKQRKEQWYVADLLCGR